MFLRPENVRVLYAPRLAFEAADVRVQTADFQRVDFAAIKRNTETLDAAARRQIANVMAAAVWKLVGDADRMRELLDQDVSDIAQVKIDAFDIGKLKAACKQALVNAWELGAAQSRREIMKSSGHRYGRSTFAKKPTTLRDNAAAYLDANGMRMAQNLGDGARAMIQQELTRAVRTGIAPTEVAALILDRLVSKGFTDREGIEGAGVTQDVLDEMEALDDLSNVPAYINTLVRTNTFEAMNEARFAEFTDPELDGWVVAFEYSSILDDSTTEFCRYMDNRVYAADNEIWDEYRPPNHYNCRSLLIPITKASGWDGQESDPPELQPADGFARCGCGKEHGLPRSVAVQQDETPEGEVAHDEGARSTFEWDESQHPRDERGRFGEGGGDTGGVGAAFGSKPFASATDKGAKAWRKEAEERYKTDKEFKTVVDAVTLYTQGEYETLRTLSEYAETGTLDQTRLGPSWIEHAEKPMSATGLYDVKTFLPSQGDLTNGEGRATWKESAVALSRAVDSAGETDAPMFRGNASQEAWKAATEMKPGDTYEIRSPSSFSASSEMATRFAEGRAPGQIRTPKGFTQYATVFEIEAGARGLNVSALSPYKQQELLTRGKYEVVSVRHSEGRDNINRAHVVLRMKR